MKRQLSIVLMLIFVFLLWAEPANAVADRRSAEALNDLPFIEVPDAGSPFALVNQYGAFLSVAEDNDTLILSGEPCFWFLEAPETGNGYQIHLEKDKELIFDLDNAWFNEGTKVHLFVYTGYECQNWILSEHENGLVIISAEDPDWCVLSQENSFILGKRNQITGNDIWRAVAKGDWAEDFDPIVEQELYHAEYPAQSYTPSPEFWKAFDKTGITDKMKSNSKHSKGYCAQYLLVEPIIPGNIDSFDFFSVEFQTKSQPKDTYWSLVNWGMDNSEYMHRNGYTEYDSVGAYAGLQMVGKTQKGIMSIWETNFSGSGNKKYTLIPTCVYPQKKSTSFDNEGSGTSLVIPFEWKKNNWYRFVLRSWNNQKTDSTYVGSWVEDLETGEVRLLAIYDTHLPDSYMVGNMEQFLENFNPDTYGSYRQMQLRNYCLHDPKTDTWVFPDSVRMSIWTDLGFNQGTYRYSASEGIFIAETCGLGKNVCKGMDSSETEVILSALPTDAAPDTDKYPLQIPK